MDNTTQRIQDLREIAVVIDTWDDIFSDFDPRPLNERTVSNDFFEELKMRYRESRTGGFIINIFAPNALEDKKSEVMVKQRLKKHFHHRFLQKKKLVSRIRLRGAIFVSIGVTSLSILTVVTYYKFLSEIAIDIMSIFLMPLGWFGFWEGLSKLIDTSPVVLQDEIFFKKLSKATYKFSYIDV
ncbi:hypothetical protein ACFL96_08200 [Thermoproteota archaeon]